MSWKRSSAIGGCPIHLSKRDSPSSYSLACSGITKRRYNVQRTMEGGGGSSLVGSFNTKVRKMLWSQGMECRNQPAVPKHDRPDEIERQWDPLR